MEQENIMESNKLEAITYRLPICSKEKAFLMQDEMN